MGIIFEDLSVETGKNLFEEKMVVGFASTELPLIVQDGIALGMTPKEIVFSMFLIAENLKEYGIMTNNGSEEDYKDVGEWTQVRAKEWIEKIKASGLLEKVKETLDNYKKKSEI